jgi:hypothetical protein
MKEFLGLGVEKLKVGSVHADEQHALAITEKVVEPKRKAKGQLTIRLVQKDKRWMIRDVDFRTEEGAREQLKQFRRQYPRAQDVPPKKEK